MGAASEDKAPALARTGRVVELESLRGLAALSVVGYHVWAYMSSEQGFAVAPVDEVFGHGRLGLTLFFVLSGYLIYRPYAAAAFGAPMPQLRRYARARILRIFPAYVVALTVLLLLTAREFSTGAVVINYLLLQSFSDGSSWILLPAWTLSIELVFYALVPVLALGVRHVALKLRTPGQIALTQLLLIGLLAELSLWHATRGSGDNSILSYFAQFTPGMAVAVLVSWRNFAPRHPLLIAAALALITYPLGHTAAMPVSVTGYWHPLYFFMFAIAFTFLVWYCLDGSKPLRARPIAALGVVSYGVYLWHSPVIHAIDARGSLWLMPLVLGCVTAITLALATASWVFIERRCLAYKDRSAPRKIGIREARAALGE